jgi:hypothetical protein
MLTLNLTLTRYPRQTYQQLLKSKPQIIITMNRIINCKRQNDKRYNQYGKNQG